MAASAAHTFGEMIGTFFEEAMKAPIKAVAEKYGLYFDTFGDRPARQTKKVSWEDINGSKHDLDYVLEKNGTDEQTGSPVAFIELAWRRYTKHSKNKAQEIAGAVDPIAQKYADLNPFKGAILSGDFTENSLEQLRSQGFHVLYIPFAKMVEVFQEKGIDLYYDEDTAEKDFKAKIRQWSKFKNTKELAEALLSACKEDVERFEKELEIVIKRSVKRIVILPLHGKMVSVEGVDQAIHFIEKYSEMPADAEFQLYMIDVLFNDGSNIKGEFKDAGLAIGFLNRIKSI